MIESRKRGLFAGACAMAIMELEELSSMRTRVERRTVNLSAYPDLVVIYLGMRVSRIAGIKTLLGFGPKISSSAAAQPDGLLRHETIIYSLFPMHVGMRQYWRNANSLLEWTRSRMLRNSMGGPPAALLRRSRGAAPIQ